MPVFEQFGVIVPWREKAVPWGNMECFRKRMLERIYYKIWPVLGSFGKC